MISKLTPLLFVFLTIVPLGFSDDIFKKEIFSRDTFTLSYADAKKEKNRSIYKTTLPKPRKSRIDQWYWTAVGTNTLGLIADLKTTNGAIDRGGREGNPIFKIFGDKNKTGIICSATAFHITYFVIGQKLKKSHPKLVNFSHFSQAMLHGLAAYHNTGVCKNGCE